MFVVFSERPILANSPRRCSVSVAAVQHLHRGGGEPDIHLLADQGVRHAVEMTVDLDVIIDVALSSDAREQIGRHPAVGRKRADSSGAQGLERRTPTSGAPSGRRTTRAKCRRAGLDRKGASGSTGTDALARIWPLGKVSRQLGPSPELLPPRSTEPRAVSKRSTQHLGVCFEAFARGREMRGRGNQGRRLSDAERVEIGARIAGGETHWETAEAVGYSTKSVQRFLATTGGLRSRTVSRALLRLFAR